MLNINNNEHFYSDIFWSVAKLAKQFDTFYLISCEQAIKNAIKNAIKIRNIKSTLSAMYFMMAERIMLDFASIEIDEQLYIYVFSCSP